MATLDIKACVDAIQEVRAYEEAEQKAVQEVGDRVAQHILSKLPDALRSGNAIRIEDPRRCAGKEMVEALLALKTATDLEWGTDWEGEKRIFCVNRNDLERAILAKSPAPTAAGGK